MKLRLGPIPDASVTKMTVAIPGPLKAQLDQYAEIHSKNFGTPVDAPTLIPLMLALFLQKDRVFQRATRQARDRRPSSAQTSDP